MQPTPHCSAQSNEFRRGRLYHELAETELARPNAPSSPATSRRHGRSPGSARTRFARRGSDRAPGG